METVPDLQTVRNKCREYVRLGILESEKSGKAFAYRLSSPMELENAPLYQELMQAVKFCSEAMPFGIVGSTLLDREFLHNDVFCWKHYFLVHTLEDQVLLKILEAMREHYLRKPQCPFWKKSPDCRASPADFCEHPDRTALCLPLLLSQAAF